MQYYDVQSKRLVRRVTQAVQQYEQGTLEEVRACACVRAHARYRTRAGIHTGVLVRRALPLVAIAA